MKKNITIYREIEQRTDAWLEIKRAKASGSGVKPIFSSRTPAPRVTYAMTLIAQAEHRHPLKYEHGYLSKAVQWGQDMEPMAIEAFEKKHLKMVEEAGWVESKDPKLKGRHGCSPDGIIDIWSWIEVKCLATQNHLKAILDNKVPTEYMPQIINYFVTNIDLKVVYFILFDPRVRLEHLRLHVIEVKKEDIADKIDEGYEKIIEFLDMKDALYNDLRGSKECSRCKKNKDRSEFKRSARSEDGLMGFCASCKKPRKK